MKSFVNVLLAFVVAFVVAAPGRTQEPAAQDGQDEEVVTVGTNEVLLDAVVRDKRGRPVKDLDASDFEVYEDGVPQRVSSFRLVTRGAAAAPADVAGATPDAGRP
ncbi:MAG TPA: hypothetical protein VGV38_20495, partial [Pyrinomonadaceae bacterium]|nr:hypothetical protein [Pyrinomonadaceae bacterium]